MASRQQIKRRIGSVKNTKQITRAMQLVAASKLRKAQDAVGKPRAYAELAREILTTLRVEANGEQFELFVPRPVKHRLLIVVTSDRGLAGAYNSNVIRRMLSEVQDDRAKDIKTSIVCVGRQVANSASRIAGLDIQSVYQELPDHPDADSLRPILTSVAALFAEKEVDKVEVIYTKFISAVAQQVQVQQLLPAGFDEVEVSSELQHAEIEPSLDALVRFATLRLLESQIYQALLDAIASEQSMRMLAMKNATDNASALVDDLTLAYNNARQAAITQELAEITGGAEAMK